MRKKIIEDCAKMKCKKCGEELEPGQRYCKCGEYIPDHTNVANNVMDAVNFENAIPFDTMSKEQILYTLTGVTKKDIAKILTDDNSNKQKNRMKYLGYLYSDKVSRDRILELKNNTEFLARYWNEIHKLTEDIRTSEFDAYPELIKYYDLWCNTIQGESLLYATGCGNIKYAKEKYGKRLFKKYKLDIKWEDEKDNKEIDIYNVESKLTEQELNSMVDLSSVGFKGFYMTFAAMTPNNKTPIFILFDNRFYPDVHITKQKADEMCKIILRLIISGQLKIMSGNNNG